MLPRSCVTLDKSLPFFGSSVVLSVQGRGWADAVPGSLWLWRLEISSPSPALARTGAVPQAPWPDQ